MIKVVLQSCIFFWIAATTSTCEPPNTAVGDIPEDLNSDHITNYRQTFEQVPSGLSEARRLGNTFPSSDFSTTGLYLPPDTELTLNVTFRNHKEGTLRLLIGTYSRYEDKWNPSEIDLIEGIQTVKGTGRGGLLYIRYHSNSAEEAVGQIDIEFEKGAIPVPHFKLGQTSHAEWQFLLDNVTDAPDVILESRNGVIVASRESALKYRHENQEELLSVLEDVFAAEKVISGLDDSSALHQGNRHKVLLTETDMEDTYMAATWYRTWFHEDAVHQIMTVKSLLYDGWGPWHEIGHMHQQDAWTWSELGEVTVNIYTLAAERALGHERSRLARDNVWENVALYLSLPDGERDFNSVSTDVFVRLAMYQQLWLAFGDEFYQQLHRITREENPAFESKAEKMRYFMLQSTDIAGVDLGNFFRQWGLKTDESVYDEITARNLPSPDVDLTKLRDDSSRDLSRAASKTMDSKQSEGM